MRKEGYHDPQTHGMWGEGRNMRMDPYTAGGETQNEPKTHSRSISDFGHNNDI